MLFTICQGIVEMQTHVDLSYDNRWPIGTHTWKIRTIKNTFAYTVKELRPTEIFGYRDLVCDRGRTVKAVAKTTVKCLVINQSDIFEIFSRGDIERLRELDSNSLLPSTGQMQRGLKNRLKNQHEKESLILKVIQGKTQSDRGSCSVKSKKLKLWADSVANKNSSKNMVYSQVSYQVLSSRRGSLSPIENSRFIK